MGDRKRHKRGVAIFMASVLWLSCQEAQMAVWAGAAESGEQVIEEIETEEDTDTSRIETEEDTDTSRIETEEDADTSRIETEEDADTSRIETEEDADTSRIETEEDADTFRIETDEDTDTSRIQTAEEPGEKGGDNLGEGIASLSSLMVNGEDILAAGEHTIPCGEGTAVFDEARNTLILNKAEIIKGSADPSITSGISPTFEGGGANGLLSIELEGENRIEGFDIGIFTGGNIAPGADIGGDVKLSGSGSLTVSASKRGIDTGRLHECTIENTAISLAVSVEESDSAGIFTEKFSCIGSKLEITAKGTGIDVGENETKTGEVLIEGSSLAIRGGKEAAIAASGDTAIQNCQGQLSSRDATALFSVSSLRITGGSLTCSSAGGNSIYSQEDVVVSGNARVEAEAEGGYPSVCAGGNLTVDSGSLTCGSLGSNGIYSENNIWIYGNARVAAKAEGDYPGVYTKGSLTVDSGSLTCSSIGGNAMNSQGDIVIKGNALLDAKTEGDYPGVYTKGNLTVDSGSLTCSSMGGAGINSQGDMVMKGNARVAAKSEGDDSGVYTKGNLAVDSGSLTCSSIGGAGISSQGDLVVRGNALLKAKTEGDGPGVYTGGNLTVDSGSLDGSSEGSSGILCLGSIVIDGDSQVKARGKKLGLGVFLGSLTVHSGSLDCSSTEGGGMECYGGDILFDGNSRIEAGGGKKPAVTAGDVTVNNAQLSAVSEESYGICLYGRLNISGRVYAKGAVGRPAVIVNHIKEDDEEELPSEITLDSGYEEVHGGRIAATEWSGSDKPFRKNSFIPWNDKGGFLADESNGLNEISIQKKQIAPVETPVITKVVSNTSAVKITWKEIPEVTGYVVYGYTGDGLARGLGNFDSRIIVRGENRTSCLEKGLKPGTQRTYLVRAYKNLEGKNHYSGISTQENTAVKPVAADIRSVTPMKKAAYVTLKVKAQGAVGYAYCTSADGKKYRIVAKGPKEPYRMRGLKKGTNYIKVRSYTKDITGKTVYGNWSETRKVKVF